MTKSELEEIEALLHAHDFGTEEAIDLGLLSDYLCALRLPHVRRRRELPPALELWEKIVPILERLNPLLNDDDFRSILPRRIVWHIAGMIYQCVDYSLSEKYDPESRREVLWLAWRLNLAWHGILDGDIENISEHVALEEWGLRSEKKDS